MSIFESRSDPRLQADQGRSINLVITSRGIAALTGVSDELAEKVMAITVPVFGRSMHSETKEVQYQPYGPTASHCNFSVSRWELNTVLMSAAEDAGCKLFFNHPLQHVDAEKGILYFYLQNPTTTQLYQKVRSFSLFLLFFFFFFSFFIPSFHSRRCGLVTFSERTVEVADVARR